MVLCDAVIFIFPQLNSARAIHSTQQQWTTTRKKLPRRIPQKASEKTTHALDIKWIMPTAVLMLMRQQLTQRLQN